MKNCLLFVLILFAFSKGAFAFDWVRSFHDSNGGGHTWHSSRMQKFDKEIFQCVVWDAINPASGNHPYTCADPKAPGCELMPIPVQVMERYSKYLELFQLTGISSVLIPGSVMNNGDEDEPDFVGCRSQYGTQAATVQPTPLKGTLKQSVVGSNTTGDIFLSAGLEENLDQTKMMFSDDRLYSCLPTGEVIPANTPAKSCCTGNNTFGPDRCCLPDYTDVSLYLNRYISSEAASLEDSFFDTNSGYIKSPNVVMSLAQQKKICCSGVLAYGEAWGNLPTPNGSGGDSKTKLPRFLYKDSDINSSAFDQGAQLNTHVYCVPIGFIPNQFN